ncbi:MAG: hypothetical protein IJA85_12945 [Clostridia bacterium]|nr:hypothetical protein [Clostridia bacterium]
MKRNLSALLAILLLLCSCSSDAGDGQTNDTKPSNGETTAPVQEETVIDKSNVLSLFERGDYDGKTYRVIASDTFNASIVVPQAPLEEENGDSVNDALYQRDAMIEDYFGIEIDYTIPENDTVTGEYIKNAVSSQEDIYDMGLASMANVAWHIAQTGMIRDMNAIDEIDLTAEWWNKYTISDLCINDKVYMATGDITNRSVTAISGYVFNKKLLKDRNMEEPYQYVYDGTWTMERMYGMYKDQEQDLNSDGKFKIADDFIPLQTGGYVNYFAAGGKILEKDSEGSFKLVHTDEKNVTLLENVRSYFTGDGVVFNVGYPGVDAFKENRSLFAYVAGCDLSLFRDMEDDYGFVPFPKGDESQKDYINPGNYWIATCTMIPVTVSDDNISFVGTMTEALAAVSRFTSIKAKYDILLLEKELRDEDSKAMAQICAETMSFDMGKLANVGGLADIMENAFVKEDDFVSKYAKVAEKAQKELDKLLEAIG